MARSGFLVAALAVLLAAAAPAAASTVDSVYEPDPYGGCYGTTTNTFTAFPGERNVVTVAGASINLGNPLPLGPCSDIATSAFALTDPGATIRPRGDCRFVIDYTNRAVRCPFGILRVSLGDMDDSLTVLAGHAHVSCGPGNDVVIGGATAADDCEVVLPG